MANTGTYFGADKIGAVPIEAVQIGALQNGGNRELNSANGTLGTPVEFVFTVPNFKTFYWCFFALVLKGTSTANLSQFGDLAALTNGCRVFVRDDMATEVEDFGTTSNPLRANADLYGLGAVELVNTLSGGLQSVVNLRYPIAEAVSGQQGNGVELGAAFEIVFEVRDDLTGLASGSFASVQGRIEP